ncbi:hypothetical protein H4W81_007377 [Nonomuraea africana]|uniref:Uncharacterized protein n=1 Tax=Nonomuraea africana TaxID=46171 RepID=A0ABR9KSN5_9ACTN|nr:hypothetical protein [Nonomuraea africana]
MWSTELRSYLVHSEPLPPKFSETERQMRRHHHEHPDTERNSS